MMMRTDCNSHRIRKFHPRSNRVTTAIGADDQLRNRSVHDTNKNALHMSYPTAICADVTVKSGHGFYVGDWSQLLYYNEHEKTLEPWTNDRDDMPSTSRHDGASARWQQIRSVLCTRSGESLLVTDCEAGKLVVMSTGKSSSSAAVIGQKSGTEIGVITLDRPRQMCYDQTISRSSGGSGVADSPIVYITSRLAIHRFSSATGRGMWRVPVPVRV